MAASATTKLLALARVAPRQRALAEALSPLAVAARTRAPPARCMCGAAHAPHEHPAPAASLHTSTAPSQAGTPGANGNASRLQRTLQHNDGFVSNKGYKEFDTSKRSTAPSVVLTCMDSRLIELLPKAMNFRTGEAKIIKTAGAILTHPFGGIMRSVLIAIFELRADEVFVVAHHDCGMNNINPSKTIEKMVTRGGIKPETLEVLSYAGIDVKKFLHGFDSVYESVHNSVAVIRNHPLMPAHIPVHGLVIDPNTGKLELLVDGNEVLRKQAADAAKVVASSSAASGAAKPAAVRVLVAPTAPPQKVAAKAGQ